MEGGMERITKGKEMEGEGKEEGGRKLGGFALLTLGGIYAPGAACFWQDFVGW